MTDDDSGIDYIARVEGEGALTVRRLDDRSRTSELDIFEPPRLFEALLRGRSLPRGAGHHGAHLRDLPGGVPDELVPAMEAAFGVNSPAPIRTAAAAVLRRVDRESPAAHLLPARPRLLGYGRAIDMAKDHPDAVMRGWG